MRLLLSLFTTTILLLGSNSVFGLVRPLARNHKASPTRVFQSSDNNNNDSNQQTVPRPTLTPEDEQRLGEKTFGGYTVKQRLREEVESPFRKVRLVFFASSAGSALTALYFSALNTLKASGALGVFADAPPMEEALTSDAINLGSAIICGLLAFRDYQAGEANLKRIAKGGQLARLIVEPAAASADDGARPLAQPLKDYRRNSRVLIAAGGEEYIRELALSLNADQLSDENVLPEKLTESDVVVVPVLLGSDKDSVVRGDTRDFWNTIQAADEERDRNFDINRANSVIAFPRGKGPWSEYLESETKTAAEQGFDVLQKGITLLVKKNGRILRRVTGQPPWADLIGTMEVMDGSRFGMPGDSERYGGP